MPTALSWVPTFSALINTKKLKPRPVSYPTIAYQLAHKCKLYANALHVADQFDAVDHNVSSQMKDLLIGPWQQSETTGDPELPLYLIVIDVLNEIKDNGGSAFLRDLLRAINKYDLRGFKFLVTSRSDFKVAESFASKAIYRLQDVPIEEARSDIKTYLKTQLPELADSQELLLYYEVQEVWLAIQHGQHIIIFPVCDNTMLSEQVDQNISAVLRYSSYHWTHHLSSPQLVSTDDLCCCISEFLQICVLFWIEAMNLLGLSNQCT